MDPLEYEMGELEIVVVISIAVLEYIGGYTKFVRRFSSADHQSTKKQIVHALQPLRGLGLSVLNVLHLFFFVTILSASIFSLHVGCPECQVVPQQLHNQGRIFIAFF